MMNVETDIDKKENADPFGIEILTNPRLLKAIFTPKIESEDKEVNADEKRESWLREKIYRIKENMLLNNLNMKFLKNVSLANIYCKILLNVDFKNYLKISEDFDAVNFDHLQKMRLHYLTTNLSNFFRRAGQNALEVNSFLLRELQLM